MSWIGPERGNDLPKVTQDTGKELGDGNVSNSFKYFTNLYQVLTVCQHPERPWGALWVCWLLGDSVQGRLL